MTVTPQEVYQSLHLVRGARVASAPSFSHSVVIPVATYSPWLDDNIFQTAYKIIERNTLVDLYRCHELWSLVDQVASVEGDILEVGVWRGGTGALMAARAQMQGQPKKVFLCDTFAGVVKAGGEDSSYEGGEHADTSVEVVETLLGKVGVSNAVILTGMFPEDTGHVVAENKFSLCHIDVDVYQSAKDVLDWVWPRLSVGGIVVYDDYGFPTCDGITRFVNEAGRKPGSVTIHNLNGHAITVKTAP